MKRLTHDLNPIGTIKLGIDPGGVIFEVSEEGHRYDEPTQKGGAEGYGSGEIGSKFVCMDAAGESGDNRGHSPLDSSVGTVPSLAAPTDMPLFLSWPLEVVDLQNYPTWCFTASVPRDVLCIRSEGDCINVGCTNLEQKRMIINSIRRFGCEGKRLQYCGQHLPILAL